MEVKGPTPQKPVQAPDQLQLQRVRWDPPQGMLGFWIASLMLLRYLTSSRVQPLEFRVRLHLLLEFVASLEEARQVCESAVGDPVVSELAEVVPPLAWLEVVMAEVGLAEAALVRLAALEVAGQAAAVEIAAAEAKRQLVLHRRSCSFYMEAHRYHRIAQSLSSAVCSTCHFYLSLLAVSFSFYGAQLSNILLRLEC
jgi:hypothetical protein